MTHSFLRGPVGGEFVGGSERTHFYLKTQSTVMVAKVQYASVFFVKLWQRAFAVITGDSHEKPLYVTN